MYCIVTTRKFPGGWIELRRSSISSLRNSLIEWGKVKHCLYTRIPTLSILRRVGPGAQKVKFMDSVYSFFPKPFLS
jgi:hypothetical protein